MSLGTNTINALTLSPDNQQLAVLTRENKTVSVWNLTTKQSEFHFQLPSLNSTPSPLGAVAFSPDGSVLAIGDQTGQVRLVDPHHGTEKTVLPGHFLVFSPTANAGVSSLAYSPDGRLLAAGGAFIDPRILVWDTETGNKLATLEGHHGFITHLAFSPDGQRLDRAFL